MKSAASVCSIGGFALYIASTSAFGSNPIGLYIGGSIGQAQVAVSNSFPTISPPYIPYRFDFRKHHFAFKAIAGVRPISWAGAEFSYVDFGNPRGADYDVDVPHISNFTMTNASMKGETAFGMLYLPIPTVDLYAKAGVARIESTANGHYFNGGTSLLCGPSYCAGIVPFHLDETQTNFAAGVGVQLHLSSLRLRAEFERFNAAGTNPYLWSVGATWTF